MPILLRAFLTAATVTSASTALADDWVSLFDGQDLSQWEAVDNMSENWKVEDGTFYCSAGNGWLASKQEYPNFELELEFRIHPGANSGVLARLPLVGASDLKGLEIQILDNDAPEFANLLPYQYCGGLYGCEAPSGKAFTKAGEWQKYHIVVDGRRVKATHNGTPIIDSDLEKHQDKLASRPGIANTTGHIGLQAHNGRVDFRNVRIKRLP